MKGGGRGRSERNVASWAGFVLSVTVSHIATGKHGQTVISQNEKCKLLCKTLYQIAPVAIDPLSDKAGQKY